MTYFVRRNNEGQLCFVSTEGGPEDEVLAQDDAEIIAWFLRIKREGMVVSAVRFCSELERRNLLYRVEATVNAADNFTKIRWQRATEIERMHPMVEAVADSLDIDAATLDEIFESAIATDA